MASACSRSGSAGVRSARAPFSDVSPCVAREVDARNKDEKAKVSQQYRITVSPLLLVGTAAGEATKRSQGLEWTRWVSGGAGVAMLGLGAYLLLAAARD